MLRFEEVLSRCSFVVGRRITNKRPTTNEQRRNGAVSKSHSMDIF